MLVAEVFVTTGRFHFETKHSVGFKDLEKAKAEFDRVADIVKRKAERKNDLPETIDLDGDAGTKVSVCTSDIATVGFLDYALADANRKGLRDAFPNLMKI